MLSEVDAAGSKRNGAAPWSPKRRATAGGPTAPRLTGRRLGRRRATAKTHMGASREAFSLGRHAKARPALRVRGVSGRRPARRPRLPRRRILPPGLFGTRRGCAPFASAGATASPGRLHTFPALALSPHEHARWLLRTLGPRSRTRVPPVRRTRRVREETAAPDSARH